ncbi:hypothetical protein BJV74DRAFT_182983 [Russula compacta]|nr:hypothetical protein BJV74DRAFT_182983 [Russula compacta]
MQSRKRWILLFLRWRVSSFTGLCDASSCLVNPSYICAHYDRPKRHLLTSLWALGFGKILFAIAGVSLLTLLLTCVVSRRTHSSSPLLYYFYQYLLVIPSHSPILHLSRFIHGAGIVFFATQSKLSPAGLLYLTHSHSIDDPPYRIISSKASPILQIGSALSTMLAIVEDVFFDFLIPIVFPGSHLMDLVPWRRFFEQLQMSRYSQCTTALKWNL